MSRSNKEKTVSPGKPVQDSGIYQSSITGRRATMVKGEPAPPTPKKGELWVQIIDTKTHGKDFPKNIRVHG